MNLQDFYPTPISLIEKLLEGIDLEKSQPILEPSAGKGDIADFIKTKTDRYRNRKIHIDCIELNPDLQHVLRGKEYAVVHDDFLTFSSLKRYNLIVANFPFSEGDKHLQKAISMLERDGGQLVCLVNAETVKNPYTNLRKTLVSKLNLYEAKIEYLSEQFTEAERKTCVEVALIRVVIPQAQQESVLLDRLAKAEQILTRQEEYSELVETDFLKAMVARFNTEAKLGLSLINEYEKLKPILLERHPTKDDPYNDSILKLSIGRDKYYGGILINDYLKELRHKYWRVLIGDGKFRSRYTSNIVKNLSDKLESLKDYDFTLFNINQLQEELNSNLIIGIEDAILKLFDELSSKFSYYDECKNNIHYYNGWKSNKAHKINTKVILPINGFSSYSWKPKQIETYGYASDRITDMVKALNYLAGELESGGTVVHSAINRANQIGSYSKLDFYYFQATFYKKGTVHITFTDQKLLDKFNIFGARKRGWLPPSYGHKAYKDMEKEEQVVVDNFQGKDDYQKVFENKEYYIVSSKELLLSA